MLDPKKLFGGASLFAAGALSPRGPSRAALGLLAALALLASACASPRRAVRAPPAPAVATAEVTIYGAEWCRPCHDAASYLSKRGVIVVERDVALDASAKAEMHAKLDRAGLSAAAIPVLDVGGQILMGFEPRAVERALVAPARAVARPGSATP